MRIGEVMTTDVETVRQDAAADAAWDLMKARKIRHLVVVEGKAVVGVLSETDLGGRAGGAVREGRTVADLMTRAVRTANPDDTVKEAANAMRGQSIGCLPVVARGKLAGLVTTSDLLELIGRGVERPVARTGRKVLRHRGPKRK